MCPCQIKGRNGYLLLNGYCTAHLSKCIAFALKYFVDTDPNFWLLLHLITNWVHSFSLFSLIVVGHLADLYRKMEHHSDNK